MMQQILENDYITFKQVQTFLNIKNQSEVELAVLNPAFCLLEIDFIEFKKKTFELAV